MTPPLLTILAVAAVGVTLLIGWHILASFRTAAGPGLGDRP